MDNSIDFSPLKGTLNTMVIKLLEMGLLIIVVYLIVYFALRAIRFPESLRHILSTAAVLVVLYYAAINGYILRM